MTLEFLDDFLNQKLAENDEFLRFTFYEIRVKLNLEAEDAIIFLQLVAQKLVNNGYAIYTTKQEYEYQGQKAKVEDNELLIAIKKIS